MLPEWLDAQHLSQVAVVLIVVIVIVALVVWRTVKKVITRTIAISLLLLVAGALWLQREELQNCQSEGHCELFGQDVHIPGLEEENPINPFRSDAG